MPDTRRVETKKLPEDVYQAMLLILRHTGESQSKFIERAIRAEVERRSIRVKNEIARREADRIANEKSSKIRQKIGKDEYMRRRETALKNEIAAEQRLAAFRMGKKDVY